MAGGLFNRRTRYLLFKFSALLGLVRWYNILVITIALYLSAIYIFNPELAPLAVLADIKLHLAILALGLFIASGYIINAFYDVEKDMINRPQQTLFDRHISKAFSLRCYVLFNTIAGVLSLLVDYRVFLINVLFSLVLWFYSHKMRKLKLISEVGAAMLSVAPFFSLAVYYRTVTLKMFEFVALIFVFIIAREICKKLIGLKGDIILGDQSIPIVIGEVWASRAITFLAMVSIAQLAFFIRFLFEGYVDYYFYTMAFILGFVIFFEAIRKDHRMVNRLYKLLILMCIFSIPFI
jgi:4-hydroxybenzoate polyprenyltransferase